MNAKERQAQILEVLEQQGFATVKQLVELLQYSSATVNRDLNALEERHLVIRSYGGVEPARTQYVPIPFRAQKTKIEKRHIGRTAAALVHDGDTIFIDGSTTAQCMGQYLIGRKSLTVITNNMILAAELAAHDVKVICLGGTVVEPPCMLCGHETVENAARYRVDKMFFATCAASADGQIASGLYDLLFRAVAEHAGEVIYLVDHEKIDLPFHAVYCDFSQVDHIISNYTFPPETKRRFPDTTFTVATDKA